MKQWKQRKNYLTIQKLKNPLRKSSNNKIVRSQRPKFPFAMRIVIACQLSAGTYTASTRERILRAPGANQRRFLHRTSTPQFSEKEDSEKSNIHKIHLNFALHIKNSATAACHPLNGQPDSDLVLAKQSEQHLTHIHTHTTQHSRGNIRANAPTDSTSHHSRY
jgi:hypothetical protein